MKYGSHDIDIFLQNVQVSEPDRLIIEQQRYHNNFNIISLGIHM